MKIFLARFVKIMLFTGVLAVLGPLLIAAVLFYLSPNARLRADINHEEYVALGRALGAWFGVMFFAGFISVIMGLPKTFTVPLRDRASFVEGLDRAAASVRYKPKGREGDHFVYKPSLLAGLLSEKIHVEVGPDAAQVSAPRAVSRKLEKKLRES